MSGPEDMAAWQRELAAAHHERLRSSRELEAEKRRRMANKPFCSEEMLIGPPSRTWQDLKRPRLRRCPFDLKDIICSKRLGGGLDGYCFKVRVGEQPYVLKVFWDPEPHETIYYWAPQRECHNAATLEMIRDAIDTRGASDPVRLMAEPETLEHAARNLSLFATDPPHPLELSGSQSAVDPTPDLVPRLRRCFGWLKFPGARFLDRRGHMREPATKVDKIPRYFEEDRKYFAILYEYVEGVNSEDDGDDGDDSGCPGPSETALDFYYRVGFSFVSTPLRRNWKSGVLIDFSDVCCPFTFWVSARRPYKRLTLDQFSQ